MRFESKTTRFDGWSVNKLVNSANNILEVIKNKGISKKDIDELEETFELIIKKLQSIIWNDNSLAWTKIKDNKYIRDIKVRIDTISRGNK